MQRSSLPSIMLSLLTTSGAVQAQEFPADAAVPNAGEIKERLSNKVFAVKLADGASWRLEFKANGYFFVNTSTGFQGSGSWIAEDGKICSGLRGNPPTCNDVRVHDEVLHLKRASGEIIQYVPK